MLKPRPPATDDDGTSDCSDREGDSRDRDETSPDASGQTHVTYITVETQDGR